MKQEILNLGCGNDAFGTYRCDIMPTKTTNCLFNAERTFPFDDAFFDSIYTENLLEHVRNVGHFLDECYRVLKHGGELVLITDNASCLRFYFGPSSHSGLYERWAKDKRDMHFCLFTKHHLENLLIMSRFNIQGISFFDAKYPSKYFDRLCRKFKILPSLTFPRLKAVAYK